MTTDSKSIDSNSESDLRSADLFRALLIGLMVAAGTGLMWFFYRFLFVEMLAEIDFELGEDEIIVSLGAQLTFGLLIGWAVYRGAGRRKSAWLGVISLLTMVIAMVISQYWIGWFGVRQAMLDAGDPLRDLPLILSMEDTLDLYRAGLTGGNWWFSVCYLAGFFVAFIAPSIQDPPLDTNIDDLLEIKPDE